MKHQIPVALQGDANWLRNTMMTLDQFQYVSIVFERNDALSHAHGEPMGEWEVVITAPDPKTGRYRELESNGEEFLAVLYDVVTEAQQMQSEYWTELQRKKEAALAKLTLEDRQVLGLR